MYVITRRNKKWYVLGWKREVVAGPFSMWYEARIWISEQVITQ